MSQTVSRDQIMKYQPLWGGWMVKEQIGQGSCGGVYKIQREDAGRILTAAVSMISISYDEAYQQALDTNSDNRNELGEKAKNAIAAILSDINQAYALRGNPNIIFYQEHQVIQRPDNSGCDVLIRMEYAASLPLYLTQNTLTQEDVVRIGIDICSALSACEKQQIVHGNIKDDCIMVAQNGTFKLGGFDLAKRALSGTQIAKHTGNPIYWAPEVHSGERISSQIDQYALGIILYKYMNNGRMPYMPAYPQPISSSDSDAAIGKRIRGEQMPRPTLASAAFAEVIMHACAYNPTERFTTAADMKRQLEIVLTYMNQEDASKAVHLIAPRNVQTETAPKPVVQAAQTDHPVIMSPMPQPEAIYKRDLPVRKRKKNTGKLIFVLILTVAIIVMGIFGLQLLGRIIDNVNADVSALKETKSTKVTENLPVDETNTATEQAGESTEASVEEMSTVSPTESITSETSETSETASSTTVETTSATLEPTPKPSPKPTAKPTPKPTVKPTPAPTAAPSDQGVKVNNAPYWNPDGEQYYEGSSVSHKSTLYVCVLAHTSQASWFPSKGSVYWKRVEAWSSGITYKPGMYLLSGGKIYLCIEEHVSSQETKPPSVQYWKKAG